MPGFCLAGLSVKVINGMKRIDFDDMPVSEISVPSVQHRVNLYVHYTSFNAHADAKGIMQVYSTLLYGVHRINVDMR